MNRDNFNVTNQLTWKYSDKRRPTYLIISKQFGVWEYLIIFGFVLTLYSPPFADILPIWLKRLNR